MTKDYVKNKTKLASNFNKKNSNGYIDQNYSSTQSFNKSIDSNGYSPNSSFNTSSINLTNNSDSIDLNGSFYSFNKSNKNRKEKDNKNNKDNRDNKDGNFKKDNNRKKDNFKRDYKKDRRNQRQKFIKDKITIKINNSSFHNPDDSLTTSNLNDNSICSDSSSNKQSIETNNTPKVFSYRDALKSKSVNNSQIINQNLDNNLSDQNKINSTPTNQSNLISNKINSSSSSNQDLNYSSVSSFNSSIAEKSSNNRSCLSSLSSSSKENDGSRISFNEVAEVKTYSNVIKTEPLKFNNVEEELKLNLNNEQCLNNENFDKKYLDNQKNLVNKQDPIKDSNSFKHNYLNKNQYYHQQKNQNQQYSNQSYSNKQHSNRQYSNQYSNRQYSNQYSHQHSNESSNPQHYYRQYSYQHSNKQYPNQHQNQQPFPNQYYQQQNVISKPNVFNNQQNNFNKSNNLNFMNKLNAFKHEDTFAQNYDEAKSNDSILQAKIILKSNVAKNTDTPKVIPKILARDKNVEEYLDKNKIDKSDLVNDEPVNKDADAQMINLEEKIDKLKINDTPVVPTNNNQIDESKTVKSLNKDVTKDKSILDKTNEQKPLIKKDQTVSNSSVSQQSQQPQQQQHDLNKIQSSQTGSTTSKPQQTSQTTQQVSSDNKKSNLKGPQSKSTGNITYEVEFLKKLQYSEFSIEKPNFGNLNGKVEILLNEPRSKNESANDMFEPMYLRPNSNNRNLMGHRSMQLGPRLNSENKVPRKIISTSLSQDVKLRTTENAWKPDRNKNFDEESTESLIKRARGLLNKLTPQNFDRISKQFLSLEVNTGDKLKRLIELIFDKATDEPAFIEQYTSLTTQMTNVIVEDKSNGEQYKFNKLLLEACQKMFEDDKYKDLNIDERQKEIDECKDKEKKQQLIDELDEEKRIIRKKSLGNIKLIGSLYKIGRLKENIMDSCIEHLINENDEDSIECLCSLLRSIGEKFEKTSKNKAKFNSQMNRLDQFVKEGKFPSRIRFLIMDVLDMRKDNWKPRKLQDVNKPKTIEEIHQDAKQRDEKDIREMSQLGNKRNDSIKKRNDWMNSGSRKSQSSNDALTNLRKLGEQRNTTSDNMPSLGPSLAPKSYNYGSWSQGASANKTLANTSQDKKVNQWQQRQDDRSQQTPIKRNLFRGTYSPGNENKEMDLISQHSSNLKSYVKSGSKEQLIESIYNICTEESTHLFVRAAIDNACESLLKNLNDIGELLTDLVIKKKIISYSQFHLGLKFHLDASIDILPDVPKFYEYIGRILSSFYLEISDNERRTFFKETLEPCLILDNALLIIVNLIKHAISIKGATEVAKKWSVGKLSFEDFNTKQSEQESKEFLKKHNLIEFVNELNNCKLLNEKSDLANQILTSNFDDVPKLLEKNLSPTDKELNKKLISALTERCILDSTECKSEDTIIFKKDVFESKLKSLPMVDFKDNDYQLEVIYTAVKVDNDKNKPKDFLLNIFVFLYDIKLIKAETFLNWVNDNRKDIPGNSVAIISLKRFIDRLQDENDDQEN